MLDTDLPSLKTIQIAEKVSSIEPSMNPAVDHCPFDFNVLLIMKSSLLVVISHAELLHLSTLDIARSSLSYCSAIELKSGCIPLLVKSRCYHSFRSSLLPSFALSHHPQHGECRGS